MGAAPGSGSDGPGLVLTQERSNTPLGRYIEHYRDKSGKLGFKDVRRLPLGQGGFVRSRRDVPSFRATPDTIWVRFSVRNGLPGARTFYLEYGYPPMDKFWMYSSRRGGGFGPPRIYGDTLKFSKREMKHRHWVFPVHLAAGERRTFYFRFQSQSVMELPFHIWEPKVFQTKDHDEQYILGIYYGIMGVMLLYNLFIYFSARDVTYLYYAGYIVCIATMEMAFNGLAYEYLWPNAAWWNNKVIGLATTLGLVAIVQFSRQLLEVDRKRYPKLNTWADITNAALLMVGIAGLFLPQRPILRVGIPLAISAAALVLTLGIVRLRSGYHPARLFMFAWSFFLIGAILHMLKNAGLFPSMFISSYGIQVGSAIEVVLLSFALADKINVLRGEKEQAQDALHREPESGYGQSATVDERVLSLCSGRVYQDPGSGKHCRYQSGRGRPAKHDGPLYRHSQLHRHVGWHVGAGELQLPELLSQAHGAAH